ncbi:glycosyl transferase family 1, partial [Staphylococcus aureus]
ATQTQIVIQNQKEKQILKKKKILGAILIQLPYQHEELCCTDSQTQTSPTFNITPETLPVVAVLHSTHIKNIDALDSSPFKNVYKAMLENLSRYRAIIVSTEQQKLDVEKRINHTLPVVNIPVGYSETIDTPVQTLDQRSVK